MSIDTLLDKGMQLLGLADNDDTVQDEQDIISKIDKEIDDESANRAIYEKAWFMNIAFIAGHHWVVWDTLTKNFSEPKAPDYRVRLTINKILPRYRQVLSDIVDYEPELVVTPNSNETIDEDSAELGTKIIKGLQVKLGWRDKKIEKTEWQLATGNAFIHYYWDTSLGQPLPTDETETRQLRTGDVNIEVVSPFEIIPLGGATSLKTCQRLVWRRYVALEYIKERWPERGNDVKEERDDTNAGLYSRKIEGLVSTAGTYSEMSNRDKGKALLIMVWERPSPKRPGGRYMVYASNVLLEDGDNPWVGLGAEFELPFVHYKDIGIMGRFWGQATIEQMIPVNKELNKGRSQIIEKRNLHAKPVVLIAKGTVDKSAWTSEPGKRIDWDSTIPGAQKPDILPPPAIMSEGEANLNMFLERDLMDIGARHEASLGKGVQGGASSGVALAGLRDADEREMGVTLIQEGENAKTLFTALLKLVQKNYTENRLLKIMGEDKGLQVFSFTGADLKDNTDVWVDNADIIPTSRRGRQSFIMELYKMGMLGDMNKDETRQRALRMIRWGNVEELWEDTSLDHKFARFENKQLSRGVQISVNLYDNHSTHLLEHSRFLKTTPNIAPELKQVIEKHILEHQNWMSGDVSQLPPEEIQKMAGKMRSMEGAPVPTGDEIDEQEGQPAEMPGFV